MNPPAPPTRTLLQPAAAASALAALLAPVFPSAPLRAAEASPTRPNVILVITDDQGYGDLSCHGNPVLRTPNLDRFHAGSVRLTDLHASPLCAPTRSALLTGRDPLRAGAWTTTTDRSVMLAGLPTVADLFAAGGYATAMFGKWHLGAAPPYRPSDRGFAESLHEAGGMIGTVDDYWGNDVIDPVLEHNDRPEKFEGYREGIASQTEWTLEVPAQGKYRIECRRWPREADAAMTAPLPPLSGTLVAEPKGKALPVASVRLRIGEREWTEPVKEGAKFTAFEVPLEAGTFKLSARMLDASGGEIADAYYLYLRKLD